MSGIYGFAAQMGISDPITMLDRMREAIPSPGPSVQHQWAVKEGYVGLGAVHPARIDKSRHFAEDPSARAFCVFDGVIYRDTGADGENCVEPNGAVLLLERYLQSGTECLSEISGSFNVAWWDAKACRLVLANDKLGHRLLFWGLWSDRLVFASMMARIMATGTLSPEIDVEGFADLLSYGYTLGERTLFKSVHTLPPASALTYEGGKVSVQQYWRLDYVEPHGRYDERRLDELADVFKIAVRRSIRPDLTCGIGLTGGLDSRCVLAAAVNQRLSFGTFTGGQPDSTDVVLARQVADQAGAQHALELIGPEKASAWLVPMVLHQGAMVATLHSHPCQFLDSAFPFDAIIQGVGGEFARGAWVSPEDLDIGDLVAKKPLKLKRQMVSKTQYVERLWKPEFRSLGLHSPEERLDAVLSEYSLQDAPVAAVEYFYLYERCRKFLNKAILIVRASNDVYLPYLDHQWLEAIAAIPISERVTNRIQIDLIKRLYPAIVDIPYTSNHNPSSALPWRFGVMRHYRTAKRTVRQRFGFGGRGRRKVRAHNYRQWSRDNMRPVLVELLYNPNAAFRPYLRWETVEALLNQHFSGKNDWVALVSALTVFEIAHKLWVDPCQR